jgi:NAD+ kinase
MRRRVSGPAVVPEVLVLKRVVILYHPRRKQALVEAEWLAGALGQRGVDSVVENAWGDVSPDLGSSGDLVAALGGDGTIIRVARMVAPCATPVLGVNLGRVGFLAELAPTGMHEKIDAIAEGKFWIERRTMLAVKVEDSPGPGLFVSLNEVGVARGPSPRAVHVHTRLDGDAFLDYTADGVLAATATGSTAYSLAAGGPILYPESTDFVLTPVAPHLHIGRSMIVPGHTVVTLSLSGDRPGILSIDGMEECELRPRQAVEVRRSEHQAHFARLGPRSYFYAALATRLS